MYLFSRFVLRNVSQTTKGKIHTQAEYKLLFENKRHGCNSDRSSKLQRTKTYRSKY